LNVAGCQAVVVWQVAHVCGNWPVTWFGFVVAVKFAE
jgi:hypothetical protein